jgi:hypothetical protein
MRADTQPRHGLQSIRFTYSQAIATAQDPQARVPYGASRSSRAAARARGAPRRSSFALIDSLGCAPTFAGLALAPDLGKHINGFDHPDGVHFPNPLEVDSVHRAGVRP